MNKFQLVSEVVSKVEDVPYLQKLNTNLGKEKLRMSNKMAKVTDPKNIPYMTIQAHNLQRKHDYIQKLLQQKQQAMKELRRKS